jgi:hypothetical protein
VRQKTAGDQRTLGVAGQPALAGPDQLVDLVRCDPVVLRVVQHREQHVEVVERIGEPERAGELQLHVTAVAPVVVQRDRRHGRGPAERVEQARGQLGTAPATQHRDRDLQRDGGSCQLRPVLRGAAQRAAEDLAERGGEHAGRGVGAVVDELPQPGRLGCPGAVTAGGEEVRIDVQQQRRGAALRGRLGIHHVRRPGGHLELMHPVRMLDEEKPEIGGRRMGGRDGHQHPAIVPGDLANLPRFSAVPA